MTISQRIAACRLIEMMQTMPEYSRKIGLKAIVRIGTIDEHKKTTQAADHRVRRRQKED